MKRLIACTLVLVLLLIIPETGFAHSTNVYNTYTKSELSGWIIDEQKHIGTSTFYYGFNDPNLSSTLKSRTETGASYWSTVANIIRDDASYFNRTNYVEFVGKQYSDPGVYAATDAIEYAANGHWNMWQIRINTLSAYEETAAAHEFGHVLGLVDLYNSGNSDKLMYYDMVDFNRRPQAADKNGVRVITGKHTSHSLGSTYYRIHEDPDRAYHRRFCVTCNIILDTACYPKTGKCNTCGFSHTGSSVNSLITIQ